GFAAGFDGRMEKLGEGFDAGCQARARARKIAVGFQRIDTAVAHRGNGIPRLGKFQGAKFLAGLLGAVTAGGNEENFRRGLDHVLDGNAERGRARAAEYILASGARDHLRHPVAANIKGLQPFEEGHAGTLRNARELLLDFAETLADLLEDGLSA